MVYISQNVNCGCAKKGSVSLLQWAVTDGARQVGSTNVDSGRAGEIMQLQCRYVQTHPISFDLMWSGKYCRVWCQFLAETWLADRLMNCVFSAAKCCLFGKSSLSGSFMAVFDLSLPSMAKCTIKSFAFRQ